MKRPCRKRGMFTITWTHDFRRWFTRETDIEPAKHRRRPWEGAAGQIISFNIPIPLGALEEAMHLGP